MSRRTGYRRNWGRWHPTMAQRRVLDRLAEGKSNAAIATELGISSETVKWHVSQLLAETALPDRDALAVWWTKTRGGSRSPALLSFLGPLRPPVVVPGAAVILVVLLAMVIWLSSGGSSNGDEDGQFAGSDFGQLPASDARVDITEAPATCEPPEQVDLRIVTPEELRAEGLTPAGQLIRPLHCPIYAANRADRTFVWLGGEGVIELDGLHGWQFEGAADIGLTFQQGLPAPDARLLEVIGVGLNTALNGTAIDLDEAQRLAVTRRTHGEGAYLLIAMQDGGFRRVAIASDGQLFVDTGPRDPDLVVNQETGEVIQTTGLLGLGRLPPDGPALTECKGLTCFVRLTVRDGAAPSPGAGRLLCPAAGTSAHPSVREFELDAGDVVIVFRSLDPNRTRPAIGGAPGSPPPRSDPWVCDERAIAARGTLPVHEGVAILEVRARTPAGAPLSVVATLDGTLYAGDVQLGHRCGMLEYC